MLAEAPRVIGKWSDSAMNCDQVFDVLTRGPFPTGTPCDTQVEAHLRGCADCRRLAEALRPALELFQEAINPEESRDLPGYWCAVATDRAQPVVTSAKELRPRRKVARRTWSQTPVVKHFSPLAVWRLAAALLLGVTVGVVMSQRGTLDLTAPLPPGVAGRSPLIPPDDDGRSQSDSSLLQELAALPAACFRHNPGVAPRYTVTTPQVLAQANLTNLICCTECHNAASEVVLTSATLTVSQACRLCHKE
jgi:hypothetical protein